MDCLGVQIRLEHLRQSEDEHHGIAALHRWSRLRMNRVLADYMLRECGSVGFF